MRASTREQPVKEHPTSHNTGREHFPTTLQASIAIIRAYRHLVTHESPLLISTVLLVSHRHHTPRRVSTTEPRAKWFAGRIPGGPTSLPGTWQEPAPLPRALSVLLQKHHGDWPQGPPSLQQDRPPGLNLSI